MILSTESILQSLVRLALPIPYIGGVVGWRPIQTLKGAILGNKPDKVKEILKTYPTLANLPLGNRQNALSLAFERSDEETFTAVLKSGAKPRKTFYRDNVSFVTRTFDPFIKIMKHIGDDDEYTTTEIIEGSLEGENILLAAIELDPRKVPILLAHGADPNAQAKYTKRPALFIAIKMEWFWLTRSEDLNQSEAIERMREPGRMHHVLIRMGADVVGAFKEAMVHAQFFDGSFTTVEIMLNSGISPRTETERDEILKYARRTHNPSVRQFDILGHGVNRMPEAIGVVAGSAVSAQTAGQGEEFDTQLRRVMDEIKERHRGERRPPPGGQIGR